MNTHPYLRAYMAGTVVPSVALLVALTVFVVTRLVLQVPIPLERIIIFPMALVPNAFGLWNMLYVWSRPHNHLPIRLHGALLPVILASIGAFSAVFARIPGDRRPRRHLVPSDRRSLPARRALVPRRSGALLPAVEVCGGIPQPSSGNRVKDSSVWFLHGIQMPGIEV